VLVLLASWLVRRTEFNLDLDLDLDLDLLDLELDLYLLDFDSDLVVLAVLDCVVACLASAFVRSISAPRSPTMSYCNDTFSLLLVVRLVTVHVISVKPNCKAHLSCGIIPGVTKSNTFQLSVLID
jgi:hypothetical protein